MRIAHALQLPALQQGGVEVLVRTLIEDTPADDEIFLISQDPAIDSATGRWKSRIKNHLAVPTGTLPTAWGKELVSWLKANRVELCHFHLSGTYGWKARSWSSCPITQVALAGIPTVATNHSATCFFSPSRYTRPAWYRLAVAARYWPGKARQLAAVRWEASVSKHDQTLTQRYFPFSQSKLIQVYHSRLNSNLPFTPPPPSRVILNVGTLAFHKGQHHLVEAFANIAEAHPDWQLKLVGYFAEVACVERIRAIIEKLGLQQRVHLCGPDPEPSRYFEECEIYVQPSLLEGLGLSLQEAMIHGRAAIGSNCGGIPELLSDPSLGRLYPAGDVSELSNNLALLMGDSSLRMQYGGAARASILDRGMTRQAMSATYQMLYRQALTQ